MKLSACLFLLAPGAAFAHPMGNFSVSHYTRLEVSGKGVEVTYVLDLAEVPAYKLLRGWKLQGENPKARPAQSALEAKAAEQAREWAKDLEFQSAGQRVEPRFVRAEIKLTDGADGLASARIASTFELEGVKSPLTFEDRNFPDRAGWKEIVIQSGAGAELVQASQGDEDRSKALTEYPPDAARTAPQELRAAVEWRADGPLASKAAAKIVPIEQPKPVEPVSGAPLSPAQPPQAAGINKDFLSRLVARKEIPLGWLLAGLAVAFGFGAAHALTPGHGKTIVAAYLVGSRGTMKHAAFLGGMVTFTHTISVFLLGLGVLFLSNAVKPEKITPVLGVMSGLSIVAVGASLFYKRLRRLRQAAGHSHSHSHDHPHPHPQGHAHTHPHHGGDHSHDHDHRHEPVHTHPHPHGEEHQDPDGHQHGPHGHRHVPEGDITLGSLIALGASGGLVPCPSAVVLLLPVRSAGVIVCIGLLMTGVSLGWVRPGFAG